MSSEHIFFEIAYALSHKRLCLFTGAGFTKSITNNTAPSWKELLQKVCDNNEIDPKPILEEEALSLEEKAQLIKIILSDKNKNLSVEISEIIKKIKLSSSNNIDEMSKVFGENKFRVITTNYDKLSEELVGENTTIQSLSPGLPIPKSTSHIKFYHIHGSIDLPERMVITSEDYFKFINSDSYFSRKLYTMLHEGFIIILGYSLSDVNLKAILNEYKIYASQSHLSSNMILVSRNKVSQHTKDYYISCFGIRVIDHMEINDFFRKVNDIKSDVYKMRDSSINNIDKVLNEGHYFKESYLKKKNSFFEIMASLFAIGVNIQETKVINFLKEIIKKKIDLTGENNAWEQYHHLALWLSYIASIFDLENSQLQDVFLSGIKVSLGNYKIKKEFGSSWEASNEWRASWGNIMPVNRKIIKEYVANNIYNSDAKKLVGLN